MSCGPTAGDRDSPNKKTAPVVETGSGEESIAGLSVFSLYQITPYSSSKKGDFFFGI
jgi:hypothetical protein